MKIFKYYLCFKGAQSPERSQLLIISSKRASFSTAIAVEEQIHFVNTLKGHVGSTHCEVDQLL